MTEPDVTLSDFILAVECAVFVALIWRCRDASPQLRAWLLVYFAAAGVASFSGGLVHGFFLAADSLGRAICWPLALLAVGINSLAAIAIGALLLFSRQIARSLTLLGALVLSAYAIAVLAGVETFFVAVAVALPAAILLFAALLIARWRDSRPGALLAASGMAITMLAAFVQQLGLAANSEYFNHNATAHVVQMVALALFFAGCVRLLNSNDVNSNGSISCLHDASF
jgi:hypothetical protein